MRSGINALSGGILRGATNGNGALCQLVMS